MLESLFNKVADLQSEILLNERLHHGYFSMEKFYVKNTFLTGYSGRLLLILRKLDIQTFCSKHINSKPSSNNSILTNFAGKLYLMSKNVDYIFMIMFLGLTFYSRVITRTIFSLKNLVYISVTTRTFKRQVSKDVKSHSAWFLNITLIVPCFSGFMLRVQVFQSPGFLGSRFFRVRVQVFQGPGPGFRSSYSLTF